LLIVRDRQQADRLLYKSFRRLERRERNDENSADGRSLPTTFCLLFSEKSLHVVGNNEREIMITAQLEEACPPAFCFLWNRAVYEPFGIQSVTAINSRPPGLLPLFALYENTMLMRLSRPVFI